MRAHFKIALIIFLLLICSSLWANDLKQEKSEDVSIADYHLSIASQNQGMLQNQLLAQTDYSDEPDPIKHPKYRSESIAMYLAIIPGFFVHGIGHYYAGDYLTGTVLLGMEIVSVPILVLVAIGEAFGGGEEEENSMKKRRSIFGISGLILFFGSWFYDIIHAPTAVKNYNDKIQAKIMFSSDQYNDIKVSMVFSF